MVRSQEGSRTDIAQVEEETLGFLDLTPQIPPTLENESKVYMCDLTENADPRLKSIASMCDLTDERLLRRRINSNVYIGPQTK